MGNSHKLQTSADDTSDCLTDFLPSAKHRQSSEQEGRRPATDLSKCWLMLRRTPMTSDRGSGSSTWLPVDLGDWTCRQNSWGVNPPKQTTRFRPKGMKQSHQWFKIEQYTLSPNHNVNNCESCWVLSATIFCYCICPVSLYSTYLIGFDCDTLNKLISTETRLVFRDFLTFCFGTFIFCSTDLMPLSIIACGQV